MSKIQLRGHCQCCGRDAAVARGRIAKHGYEVRDRGMAGYFSGVCSGHSYEPVEVRRDTADDVIRSCRGQAIDLYRASAEYKEGKRHPATVGVGRRLVAWKWVDEDVAWEDAVEYYRAEALKAESHKALQRAKVFDRIADDLQRVVDAYHGLPLKEVPIDDGPEPIAVGEKRDGARGVLTAEGVYKGMVRWIDHRGFKGRMSTRSWRLLPKAEGERG